MARRGRCIGRSSLGPSPKNAIASFNGMQIKKEDRVVKGFCAYVPQVGKMSTVSILLMGTMPKAPWLRNASINIRVLWFGNRSGSARSDRLSSGGWLGVGTFEGRPFSSLFAVLPSNTLQSTV